MPGTPRDRPAPEAVATPGMRWHPLPVPAAMAGDVRALLGVEIEATGPLPLAIAPHESLVLAISFDRRGGIEAKAPLGRNARLTGIRQWTGSFVGDGHCVTLWALLTPLGAVRLLRGRALEEAPRIRAPLEELLPEGQSRALEDRIATATGVPAQLHALARWIEDRAAARAAPHRHAMRAARAAMRLSAEPTLPMEQAAAEQHVSRRQLERDFERWLGIAPRQLAQVARLQHVVRAARHGATLADAAAGAGFADQAHMGRTVRRLTGLAPRAFLASQRTPIAGAFRALTRGGTVYL
jgi:AraC-like DNA-binding protein